MDVTRFLDLAIAPKVLFDTLEERKDRVRFWVPRPGAGTDLSAYTAVTYGAFAADVRALGSALTAELEPGDRAAIFAPNRVEWATAALAVQAVGGVIVPVYPASTPAQLAYVLDHSDARVVFVDTPALLAKVLEAWPSLHDDGRGLRRVVLLDAGLDSERVLAKVRAEGRSAPSDEALARVLSLTDLLTAGAARDAASPGAF